MHLVVLGHLLDAFVRFHSDLAEQGAARAQLGSYITRHSSSTF